MKTAPVLLFTFNRPVHTRRTIAALADNELAAQTRLIIHSDGPRNHADQNGIEQLRAELRETRGFASITLIEQPVNQGLATSIVTGVSDALQQHDRVIILEDDMLTSRYFLRYMNEALEMYQHSDAVASIHGYTYPIASPLAESFFLKGADCWGWATWRDAWQLYRDDGQQLLDELKSSGLLARFDFNHSYPYTQMLKRQISGKNNSWAIRWYASTLLADKLCLYPGRSLVHNIGNDASGEHSAAQSAFDTTPSSTPIALQALPTEESAQALSAFSEFLRNTHPGVLQRLIKRLRRRTQRSRQ